MSQAGLTALHAVLITAHAVAGLVALCLGAIVLRPPHDGVPRAFRGYLAALWVMVLGLAAVVAGDWPRIDAADQALFGALTAFALYIGWRGLRARRRLLERRDGWAEAYMGDVGFTLIALFDGFVIVAAVDLGARLWLVLLVAATGVALGRLLIGWAKHTRRALPTSTAA